MENNQIKDIVNNTLEKLKGLMDSDCIIGKSISGNNGEIIIPICKATIGFVSGGGEYSSNNVKKQGYPFSGGSSAGCSVTPIGFLIVGDRVDYINTSSDNVLTKVFGFASKICEDIINDKK